MRAHWTRVDWRPFLGGAILLAIGCGASEEPESLTDLAAAGRALAEEHCSVCHAIGAADASTHRDAPPFRTLTERYPAEYLAESLAEGIMVGHEDMPALSFSTEEIDAFITYLESFE